MLSNLLISFIVNERKIKESSENIPLSTINKKDKTKLIEN